MRGLQARSSYETHNEHLTTCISVFTFINLLKTKYSPLYTNHTIHLAPQKE
jgi:hypothetical protein